MKKIPYLILTLALSAFAADEAPKNTAFRFDAISPHTTLGFYGDSITQGVTMGRAEKGGKLNSWKDDMDPALGRDMGGLYHQYIQLFLATRFPGKDLQTLNLGHSGGTAEGGIERLTWDFLPDPPAIVFVHFGMNDVKRPQYPPKDVHPPDTQRTPVRDTYRKNMTQLTDRLAAAGSTIIILSPTNYDDTAAGKKEPVGGHLNEELGLFGGIGKELAEQKGYAFVDLHTPMTSITAEKQKENPKWSFTADRIHPKNGGDEVMAYTILKTLEAPGIVYDVALDAAGKPVREENAKLSGASAEAGGLAFTLEENALPFPVLKNDRGFAHVPFQEELNRQLLTVTGLAPGQYQLTIDGTEVGAFSAEDFAAGINLATIDKTPQFKAAKELHHLIVERKFVIEQRMCMVRNNLRFSLKQGDAANYASIDWNDPQSMLASVNRAIDGGKAKGWGGFVLGVARYTLENYQQNVDERAAIRKQIAALPASYKHDYALTKK